MKIANIYSVKNQSFYKHEKVVMLLAHIMEKGLYEAKHFNDSQYVILDNGLYEGAQVSSSLRAIVDMAERIPNAKGGHIQVNEFVIPDSFGNCDETIALFEKNLKTIERYGHRYTFMLVAQAANYDEYVKMFNYINNLPNELPLVIGIPKLSVVARDSAAAIEMYKSCKFPIHFLGLTHSFDELIPVRRLIRSCDTSQVEYIAKYIRGLDEYDYADLINYPRGEGPIDLIEDEVGDNKLKETLKRVRGGLEAYGIL